MPSPFSGMDPYLEQDVLWHDLHKRFLPAAAAQISSQVLPRYIVVIDEQVYLDEERETFLTVRDRLSREIVTVIELLSPSNKRSGENRGRYLSKRADILVSPAHLVEIDLLRGGKPMPAEERPECTYSILVSRADDRPSAGFWPIRLVDTLPIIPVPLRGEQPPAQLDLRAIIDRVYEEAGYRYYLYDNPPDPPLTGSDAEWAEALRPTT
jgi:hypothetical protein